MTKTPPPPARALRAALRRLGLHPDDPDPIDVDLTGRRALVVATNHGVLDVGKPTGVFASELTVPYYAFLDAGMVVDVASPDGGVIPVDPQSLKPVIRTEADDRFLADDELRAKVTDSLSVADLVNEVQEIELVPSKYVPIQLAKLDGEPPLFPEAPFEIGELAEVIRDTIEGVVMINAVSRNLAVKADIEVQREIALFLDDLREAAMENEKKSGP